MASVSSVLVNFLFLHNIPLAHLPPSCIGRPSQEMVKHVISRQCDDVDRFATSLLRHWSLEHTKELAEHLTSLLTKSRPRNTPPRTGLRQRFVDG